MKIFSGLLLSLVSLCSVTNVAMAQNQTMTKYEIETVQVAQDVLLAKYKFKERSGRVKTLQRAIGRVSVDGLYGPLTRKRHIAVLKKNGLPTTNVPKVPKPVIKYNISYDKSKRCPQYEASFADHGLEPVEVFSYIAWRESRCNPKSVNAIWENGKIVWTLNKDGSYDSGLLQINSSWKTVTSEVCEAEFGNLKVLRNVDCNLRVAKFLLVSSKNGLGHWSVRRTN
jgi:hypothetical protein